MKLIYHPDEFLERKVQPVDLDNPSFDPKELRKEMEELMLSSNGIGLSANQVGIDVACFVIGDGQEDGLEKAFFNPEILGVGGDKESVKEGCLSFPGLWLMVSRPAQVMIKYYDEEGEEKMETYEGVTSRVIQHEYDHMIGQNFTMRVTKLKLDRAMKALEKKIKKYQRQQSGLQQA